MSFSIGNLRFIDSYQFMPDSLGKLAANLRIEDFKHTTSHSLQDKLHLLLRRGVFSNSYWDSPKQFYEKKLPAQEVFYNRLTEEHVTDEEYQHAVNVWNLFEVKTLSEYHDLYLKTEVLLLCDIFENVRKVCLNNYQLDPAHYFSSLGLAWDAMLKKTGVVLELMRERELHDIVDKGIRGGICCISKKYAEANNKYLNSCDASKPSSYIVYLDMNNLYSTAMTQPLPEGNFKFIPVK